MPVLLAVDGNSLLHRAFHAQAGVTSKSGSGHSVWAVRGLLTQLVAAVERVEADAVLVGFDDPRRSIRRDTWPQYKANRLDKPDSLVSQLLLAASVLRELGVAVAVPDGLEADDVLCSAATQAAAAGVSTVIMTSDRDSFALIDTNTKVLRILNGGVEASPVMTADRLVTLLGVRPDQYRDFAALRGDPSDNLPGVNGIGPKTATRLLAELNDAASAFLDIEQGGARVVAAVGAGAAAKLAVPQARQRWQLNCQVMRMHADVPLPISLISRQGQGHLPLAQERVRAVFGEHQLIASTAVALRVLAHCEGVPAPVSIASSPAYLGAGAGAGVGAGAPEPEHHHSARFTPRHPPLPKPAAKTDQLSLF